MRPGSPYHRRAIARTSRPRAHRISAGAAALTLTATALASCSSPHTPTGAPANPAPTTSGPATSGPTTGATPANAHPTSSTSPGPPATAAPPAASVPAWTTYQDGPARLGDAAGAGPSTPLREEWTAALDGAAVYGQPLEDGGRVVVATEDDDLYALDATTGRVDWEVRIGTPLQNVVSVAGCGDIDPLGVTSTPVIDPTTGTVYAVGETSTGGSAPVSFQMVAVDLTTGRLTWQRDVTPPLPAGESPVHLLQRAALAAASGRVYVGFGGQYGDCGSYHGWVVSVPESGSGTETAFDVTPASTGGAVWNGGAGPAIGPDGSVYVTTGNPNSGGPAPWAEAVLKLDPLLATPPEAAYQDPAASGDLDLATGGPLLLPDGTVFAVGKTDIGYLLPASSLIPAATVSGRICGSDPDGGSTFDAALDAVFVPCRGGGIQQVDLATRRTGWRAGGADSTVVTAGRRLWSLDDRRAVLYEMDPSSGRTLYSTVIGRSVPTFASLSVVGGTVLVPTRSGVEAFRGG